MKQGWEEEWRQAGRGQRSVTKRINSERKTKCEKIRGRVGEQSDLRFERWRQSSDGWTVKGSNLCHIVYSEPRTSLGRWHEPDDSRQNGKEGKNMVPFWQDISDWALYHIQQKALSNCETTKIAASSSSPRLQLSAASLWGSKAELFFFPHKDLIHLPDLLWSSDRFMELCWTHIKKERSRKFGVLLIHGCILAYLAH